MKNKLLIYGLLFLLIFFSISFAIFTYLILQCPQLPASIQELGNHRGIRILAENGQVINKSESSIWLEKNRISPLFFQALLAVEDHRFYHHHGINFIRFFQAVVYYSLKKAHLYHGHVAGGSTITQQLSKNLFLKADRSVKRKILELITAIHLEYRYSKDDILTTYANIVHLGTNRNSVQLYGIEQASLAFFGKSCSQLELNEAALMAGLLKAGSYYNPIRYPKRANQRRKVVLKRMLDCGYINRERYQAIIEEDIDFGQASHERNGVDYCVGFVRSNVLKRFGYDLFQNGSLVVYTTFNLITQEYLADAIQKNLVEIDRNLGFKIPYDSATPEMKKKYPQVAAIAVSVPGGEIRALAGGRNYYNSDFNRVVNASRQLGSAFKPLNYATAFSEDVITQYTTFKDEPIVYIFNSQKWISAEEFLSRLKSFFPEEDIPLTFTEVESCREWLNGFWESMENHPAMSQEAKEWLNFGHWQFYAPSNDSRTFSYEEIDYKEALTRSLNTISVQILAQYNMDRLVELARSLGFKNIPGKSLSLALGALDATPLQVAGAYLMLAGNGYFTYPYAIRRILDGEQRTINIPYYFHQKILNSWVVYQVRQAMENVVDHGTGSFIRRSGYTQKAAGKTGTSSNHTNAWFCGFTPNLVCIVWVGFDDNRPLVYQGKSYYGGSLALPIWLDFMKNAVPDNTELNFQEVTDDDFDTFYKNRMLNPSDSLLKIKIRNP